MSRITANGASATVTVVLPAALVRLFAGSSSEVTVPASTVGDMIAALDQRWPGIRDRLCDSRPAIRRNINVFVGPERASLDTPLAPGAKVTILLAVIG